MTVRRNHRKKWIVDICYTHTDGREQRITRTSPVQSRRGTQQYERQVRQALLDGTYRRKEVEPEEPDMPTLAAFVKERWLPVYPAAAGNRPCTVREKNWCLGHILPALGELPLDAINAEQINRLVAELRSQELSPKSAKNICSVLRRVLATAVEWEVLERLPRFPKIKVPPPTFDHLTPAESQALVDAAGDDEQRVLLLCALHTGMRKGEQAALEWRDIDWTRDELVVRRSRPTALKQTGPTKNGRTRRIPLTGELSAGLKRIRHLRGPLVFCRPDGKYLESWDMNRVLKPALTRAKLRHIRWHDMRHTMASQAVARGVPLNVVQAWLGHTTITMTMRYAHLAPDGGSEWIRVLEREHDANAQEVIN